MLTKLYLATDNPLNTALVSADGVVQYHIRTPRPPSAFRTTHTCISVPTDSGHECVLGEITWGSFGRRDTVRSVLFGPAIPSKIKVKDFLFSDRLSGKRRSWMFLVNGELYRWNFCDSQSLQLIQDASNTPLAKFQQAELPSSDDWDDIPVAFPPRAALKIFPTCPFSPFIVVLSFILVEKMRRDALHYTRRLSEPGFSEREGVCEGGAGELSSV